MWSNSVRAQLGVVFFGTLGAFVLGLVQESQLLVTAGIVGFLVTIFLAGGMRQRAERAGGDAIGEFCGRHDFAGGELDDDLLALEQFEQGGAPDPERFLERDRFVDRFLTAPLALAASGRSSHDHGVGVVHNGRWRGEPAWILGYSIFTTVVESDLSTRRVESPYVVAGLELAHPAPALVVGAEGILSGAADWLGLRDLEVGDEAIDRQLQIEGESPELAREVVDAAVAEALRALPSGAALEVGGDFVIARCHLTDVGDAEVIESLLEAAAALQRRVTAAGERLG